MYDHTSPLNILAKKQGDPVIPKQFNKVDTSEYPVPFFIKEMTGVNSLGFLYSFYPSLLVSIELSEEET